MFTFNFGNSCSGERQNSEDVTLPESLSKSAEVVPPLQIDLTTSTRITLGSIEISVVDTEKIVKRLRAVGSNELSSVLRADDSHSDLVPGVYEGGMKIWECTYDLGDYLVRSSSNFVNKSVLDLGCGSGVLGILAYKLGADFVHFQDYNSEVLTYLTIPNVALNSEELARKSKYWSGDWTSYEKVDDTKFDIILTSETIYNLSNQQKLLRVLKAKLKTGGVIFVAGKCYYFGVGGSMKLFVEAASCHSFSVESVWTSTEGVKREIVLLKPAS